MKLLILILTLSFHPSCTTLDKRERLMYYDGDNKPQTEIEFIDGKRSGGFTIWYPGGEIKKVTCSKISITDIQCEHFYPSGVLLRQYTHKNQILNGPYQQYYENGQLQISGHFLNANRHQKWMFFEPNGLLLRTITYSNNLALTAEPKEQPPCPELTQNEIDVESMFQFILLKDWCAALSLR